MARGKRTSPSDDGTDTVPSCGQKRFRWPDVGYPSERFLASRVVPTPAAPSFDPLFTTAVGSPRAPAPPPPPREVPFSFVPAQRSGKGRRQRPRSSKTRRLSWSCAQCDLGSFARFGLLRLTRRAAQRAVRLDGPVGNNHPDRLNRELGIGARTLPAQPCRRTAGFAAASAGAVFAVPDRSAPSHWPSRIT
jgi:hypothetical protein